VAAEYGPKWCGKVPKEFIFQKQADHAAAALTCTAPDRGYDFNARRWAIWKVVMTQDASEPKNGR
jgi:hypothetical protein